MGKQTAPQRTLVIQERKTRASDLYVKGWTHLAISDDLGISRTRVGELLEEVREEWQAARIKDYSIRVDRELAKLDRIESQAWLGWERSLLNAESQEREKGMTPKGKVNKLKKKVKAQSGDHQFLGTIQKCVEIRCRLLGLFMDKQGEAGDRVVIPVVTVVVNDRAQLRVPISKDEFDSITIDEPRAIEDNGSSKKD